jgi:hypothetical protein
MNVFGTRPTGGPPRRWLVLSAPLLVAAACSGAAVERSSTPPASLTAIDAQVMGGGEYPGYTVEVPPAWSAPDGHFVVKPGPGVLGLSVWDVGTVPRDPCHWQGQLRDPGPTVDDLVEALTTQRLRHAMEPTDVTLGGYQGRYLEWSVPADMVVTGDADFEGCDVEPSNGHRDFVSWVGNGYGERYQQVAGQVDRLWVLDVDGQRLLVDATYSPDTTEADRGELAGIVVSLRFTDHAT